MRAGDLRTATLEHNMEKGACPILPSF